MSTTNITLDDTSPTIVYSSNWAAQFSSNSSSISQFFGGTYHSAQANGATANLTFNGSAIYIYGTKGPEHASYSIQFDNYIINYSAVTGAENRTRYQQPLFAYTFPEYGTHFVQLTAIQLPDSKWLDLDYVTITMNGGESVPAASISSGLAVSQTILPPWNGETDLDSGTPSSAEASSHHSKSELVLAIAFGVICGIILLISLVLLLRRLRKVHNPADVPDVNKYGSPRFSNRLFGKGDYGPTLTTPPGPGFLNAPEALNSYKFSDYTNGKVIQPVDKLYPEENEKDLFGRDNVIPQHSFKEIEGRRTPSSIGGSTLFTTMSNIPLLQPQLLKGDDNKAILSSNTEKYYNRDTGKGKLSLQKPNLRPSRSNHLPVYSQRRTVESVYSLSSSNQAHEDARRHSELASYSKRPLPALPQNIDSMSIYPPPALLSQPNTTTLSPLHASHRPEVPPEGNTTVPVRPKRPEKGLLDWLGGSISETIERATKLDRASRKRREDANSQRTDFLKV